MSLTSTRDFSIDRNADISFDADAPIVPANATHVVLSPNASRFLTMTSALASDRGEQKDKLVILGLKIYGLSPCSPSI